MIRVAIVGTGFMGRALARHIETSVPGMDVAAVMSRSPSSAEVAMRRAALQRALLHTDRADDLDNQSDAIAIASDLSVILEAETIDVLVDATGSVEAGIGVAERCIEWSKPLVSLNAEVDATVGPILNLLASEKGVVRSVADGDQPGVQLRLADFARSRGLVPRLMGNVKGLHDVRRTPTTQAAFAARWGQNVRMVTSFADGTKVNFEQAVVANAMGFGVLETGMRGVEHAGHIDELPRTFGDDLADGVSVVDYVVGARPAPGVFCIAEVEDPWQREYLDLFKLGGGPWYTLYQPYHLCHLEVPTTIRESAFLKSGLGQSTGGPQVEVVATAKRDLKAGSLLDGIGGYHCYGQVVDRTISRPCKMLPMAAAQGLRIVRSVRADCLLTYDDVEVPGDRSVDRLLMQQAAVWP